MLRQSKFFFGTRNTDLIHKALPLSFIMLHGSTIRRHWRAAKTLSADEWNNLCWHKTVANIELTRALQECDKSIAALDRAGSHDSRAFVLLRLDRFEEAIKEYDVALASGDIGSVLYGRAIAYARVGKKAESATDAAKALKLDPLVARQFSGYGLIL